MTILPAISSFVGRTPFVAAFAAALAVIGCSEKRADVRCATLCKLADRCNLLPSLLGAAKDDCTARCRQTPVLEARRYATCVEKDEGSQDAGNEGDDWCDLPGASRCAELARCIDNAGAPAPVAGVGVVTLTTSETSGSSADNICGDKPSMLLDEKLCPEGKLARLVAFRPDGRAAAVSGTVQPCVTALQDTLVVGRYAVGLAVAGIQVFSPSELDEDDEPRGVDPLSCVQYDGPPTRIAAGETVELTLSKVERAPECDVAVCEAYARDSCADPLCADLEYCREQVCDDARDNDLDSLTDCADPDCACETATTIDAGAQDSGGPSSTGSEQ